MRLTVLIIWSLVNGPPLTAQQSWCRYRPGTIDAIVQQHREDVVDTLAIGQRNWAINASFRGVQAPVIYLGQTRPLSVMDSSFLDGYFYRVLPDTGYRALFHRAASFVTGRDTLWAAMQDSLIPALAREAKAGDTVTLFVSWLGMHQEGPKATWVFVVNEFATATSRGAWDRVLASCPPQ